MMATVVQKNGLKPLSNGNSLVHHEVKDLTQLAVYQDGYKPIQQTIDQSTLQQPAIEQIPIVQAVHGQNPLEYNSIGRENNTIDQNSNSEQEAEPEIDIVINNVVCSFSVRCHLNLREIALNGMNVEYRKENGMITMKIRRPYTTASIWSSGKVTCTGATSEMQAKIAARRFARCLQKLGFDVRFNNYRVVNVLGTCSMPFAIKINSFSERHKEADYEPELHPGVTYKLKNPKATLKIFSTGSVTVTAPSVADVQAAIEHIFPLVYEFRKEKTPEDLLQQAAKKRRLANSEEPIYQTVCEEDEEETVDSDHSWD